MPIQESGLSANILEECRALLNRLPGIYAAGLRTGENGAINEIHILANSAKNPKQMVRDVQSTLLAAFDLDIDHRIVSIAQLSEDPTESGCSDSGGVFTRLRYKGSSFTVEDDRYTVRITLTMNGSDYVGAASCRDSAAQRMRAVCEATLAAVHEYLGNHDVYTLLAVQSLEIAACPVVISLLEYAGVPGGCLLVGAARSSSNEAICTVKATLDALNRTLGKTFEESNS